MNKEMEQYEKELTLFTKYQITSADTDMQSRLKLGALTNLLIQSAIASAERLGFGFSGLREQQLFWVLRNLTVEVYRPIMWSEEVEVETWPKDIEGVLYLRDFVIRDAKGQVVARATSGWLALDLSSKRPKRFSEEHMLAFTRLKAKHALDRLPEKLAGIAPDTEVVSSVTSRFSDIDLNRHVTSTRYIDWIVDTLPLVVLTGGYPQKYSINYLKETMLGEEVSIKCNAKYKGCYEFEGVNIGAMQAAFRMNVEF